MSTSTDARSEGIRLQKVLAAAGLGSRRGCEEIIAAGRVEVNGRTATLGIRVDPAHDIVRVDGAQVPTAAGLVHFVVHKPRGMLSTMSDDRGRPSLGDMVEDLTVSVHHVGRLDADSEGLIILTNDGPLSHRLTHPSFGVPKVYVAEVEGVIPRAVTRSLTQGIELDDGPVRADAVKLVDANAANSVLEITIHEGRNHIVRRMFDTVGYPVTRLARIAVGPIRLGDLKPGSRRRLQPAEVQSLYRAVGL